MGKGRLIEATAGCPIRMTSLIGGLLCVGVVTGCVANDVASPSFTVSDSAGVEIVTSHSPAWSEGEAWRVERRPVLRISQLEGPPELTFSNVRAVGWLPDGRIFVGDDRAHSIRIFSPEGDYLASAGREGRGPGELMWFMTVSVYRGDSLFVYDYSQRALSVFAPDLAFARRFNNPTGAGNYRIVSALTDGRFLLSSPGHNGLTGGPGLVPDTSLIIVSAPDGAATDTVGAFEATVQNVGADRRNQWLFLQPSGTLAAAGDRIVWLEGKTFQYMEADADGTLRRIVRKRHDPIPVTEETISDFQAHYIEWLTTELIEGTMDDVYESLEIGEYYPQLPATSADLEVDALGNVWVGHYHYPGALTEDWEVFDAAGVWLGSVETPTGFEVHEITADRIIGVAHDELGVPYVQVHRLDRR